MPSTVVAGRAELPTVGLDLHIPSPLYQVDFPRETERAGHFKEPSYAIAGTTESKIHSELAGRSEELTSQSWLQSLENFDSAISRGNLGHRS